MARVIRLISWAFCAGTFLLNAAPTSAFETPTNYSAKALLGQKASGANYRILDEVESDGLYRTYHIKTEDGVHVVVGDSLLAVRLRELAALSLLNDASGAGHFLRAFGESAIAPLKFGGQLIISPVETVQRSANSVSNMFDSWSASSENKNPERESFMGGVLGTDIARREIASDVGVDPYTDFPPLAKRLRELAAATGMGGLSLRGAMVAIPGGAALPSITATTTRTLVLTASSIGTAQSLQNALRTKTAGQIMRDSRERLLKVTRSPPSVEVFLQNPIFTPSDVLVITTALETLRARDSSLFLNQAAEARDRNDAFFFRTRAEIFAGLKTSLATDSFLMVSDTLMMRLKDGRLVAALPADGFFWTEQNEHNWKTIAEEASKLPVVAVDPNFKPIGPKSIAPTPIGPKPIATKPVAGKPSPVKPVAASKPVVAKNPLFVITGEFSPLARKELAKLKWDVARVTLQSQQVPLPAPQAPNPAPPTRDYDDNNR